jgi:hypothetical protein
MERRAFVWKLRRKAALWLGVYLLSWGGSVVGAEVGDAFRLENDNMAKCLDGSAPGESGGGSAAESSSSLSSLSSL